MSLAAVTNDMERFDRGAVLRELGLNGNDPAAQAALLVCQRYNLDPVLKHVVLISRRVYVTRDGYLHHAHASGQFDGIELSDVGETDTHWTATAAVYRKDMTRPFKYPGRYPKTGTQKAYGIEMAIKVAEVMALRRAFPISGASAAEEAWDSPQHAEQLAAEPLRVQVRSRVADLDENDKAGLRLFCAENDIPNVPSRMSSTQAQAVLDWLDAEPEEPDQEDDVDHPDREAAELFE